MKIGSCADWLPWVFDKEMGNMGLCAGICITKLEQITLAKTKF